METLGLKSLNSQSSDEPVDSLIDEFQNLQTNPQSHVDEEFIKQQKKHQKETQQIRDKLSSSLFDFSYKCKFKLTYGDGDGEVFLDNSQLNEWVEGAIIDLRDESNESLKEAQREANRKERISLEKKLFEDGRKKMSDLRNENDNLKLTVEDINRKIAILRRLLLNKGVPPEYIDDQLQNRSSVQVVQYNSQFDPKFVMVEARRRP